MCEKPQAFRQITRKARKPHKCCECGRVIATGQHYEYSSGIWDSEPGSFKTCLDCARLRDNYQSFTGEVFVIGELYENLLDLGLELDDLEKIADESGAFIAHVKRMSLRNCKEEML